MKLNKQHPLYREDIKNILSICGLESIRGKSFLITGATGMIGVMLTDTLMAMDDVKVIAVGRDKGKAEKRLGEYFGNPNFEFLEQDVCNPFPEGIAVDYIIPAAGNTHPLAYSHYPIETIMINVKGVEHALDLAARCGATVVYTSSGEVYGNALSNVVFKEDDNGKLNLSDARACYNESKRIAEALCQSYIAERGVNVKIGRFCRIFGPPMPENDSKCSTQFIKNALEGKDIVLKSEGNQYFSFMYIADAVAGLLNILLHGETGKAYNVSSEKTNIHLRELAQLCADCVGSHVVFDIPSVEERKGYSKAVNVIMSNERIKEIGFKPIYTMENAIRRTIEILR